MPANGHDTSENRLGFLGGRSLRRQLHLARILRIERHTDIDEHLAGHMLFDRFDGGPMGGKWHGNGNHIRGSGGFRVRHTLNQILSEFFIQFGGNTFGFFLLPALGLARSIAALGWAALIFAFAVLFPWSGLPERRRWASRPHRR